MTTRTGRRLPAAIDNRSSEPPPRVRTLLLLAKQPRPDIRARIAAGEEPRVEYLELARRLGAEILDYHAVEASDSPLVRWLRRRHPKWGLAWLGFRRRQEFDHLYATGEDVGIPLAILLRAARCYDRMTMVVHGAGTPKRRLVLRALGSRIYRYLIVLGTAQQQLLTDALGVPAAKVVRLDYWCDQQFFRPGPAPAPGDYIMSAGMERRDYATLQAAARGLTYPVRIVASGWSPGAGFTAVAGVADQPNITVVRGIAFRELRELYARARFIVVPLQRVNYAAGVTTIVEAMAMGKAVIVSASPGILDYVQDGRSGKVVPVGDAAALRAAIIDFWEHPARVAAMGRYNRAWIETAINTDQYVARVAELFMQEHIPG